MPGNYIDYNQYLGARRCCDLRGQGPEGPQGPTGPAAMGPRGLTGPTGSGFTGPTGRSCKGPTGDPGPPAVGTSVLAIDYSPILSTAVIPTQTLPIQYYSLNMTGLSNALTTITFDTSLPAGYQAIIFINGNDTNSHKIGDGSGIISGINFLSSNTQQTLTKTPGTPTAILTIYSDGTSTYGNLALMY